MNATPDRPYTVTCQGITSDRSPILWAVSRNAAMVAARRMGLKPIKAVERIH